MANLVMKLRFRVGRTEGRKDGDIEALADAMQTLKKVFLGHLSFTFM